MNYKRICLAAVAASLVLVFALQRVEPDRNRYHQHLQAAEKAPCTGHGEDTFCTHLPLISITTDDVMPDPYCYDQQGNRLFNDRGYSVANKETVGATVTVFDSEEENNHLQDEPVIDSRAVIRVRGASSRAYDKKGYFLEFRKEDMVKNRKVELAGMAAENEWVLHGPFLDKTLIRNYLCYNLSGEIMEYAPNVRFCELILNGEYQGLYLIVEKIGYSQNGRIDITKSDPDMNVTSYILRADRGADDPAREISTFGADAYLTSPSGDRYGQLEVEYPGKTLTQEQMAYIETDFSRFEKALFSYDYNIPGKGYSKYIDVDSFVDYFLINEFTLNYDALSFSTYFYKDIGELLKLCVWDFNSAFDYYHNTVVSPETFHLHKRMWYSQLFKDEVFVHQVVTRYWQLREEFFSEEYLHDYIDDTLEYLGPAIARNYEKWGYTFNSVYNGVSYDYLVPAERNVRSFDEAVTQLKDCISDRIVHMDSNLDRLYSLCHKSVNKDYNYDKDAEGTYG